MQVHELKTLPKYFEMVVSRKKLFEWRKNDRDFHAGDLLLLREWRADKGVFTGRSQLVRVDLIIDDPVIEIPKGFVILGITPVKLVVEAENKQ